MPISKFNNITLDGGKLVVRGFSPRANDLASLEVAIVALKRDPDADPNGVNPVTEKRIVRRLDRTKQPPDPLPTDWKTLPVAPDVPGHSPFAAGERVVLIGAEIFKPEEGKPPFIWHGIFEILTPGTDETPFSGTFEEGPPTRAQFGEVRFD